MVGTILVEGAAWVPADFDRARSSGGALCLRRRFGVTTGERVTANCPSSFGVGAERIALSGMTATSAVLSGISMSRLISRQTATPWPLARRAGFWSVSRIAVRLSHDSFFPRLECCGFFVWTDR